MDPQTSDVVNALRGNAGGQSYWPGSDDIALSRQYDALYGNPAAPNATPGAAYVGTAPLKAATAWASNDASVPEGTTAALNTSQDADRVRAEGLAAERSAVAKLGWNPSLSVSSPSGNERGPFMGLYKPSSNITWNDQNAPAAAMHESMHRGIEMLGKRGNVPIDRRNEEAYVRALMNRAYGNVELDQYVPKGATVNKESQGFRELEAGRRLSKDPLIDQLEKLAAAEVARRHPGGPR